MQDIHITVHPLDAGATRGDVAQVGPLTLRRLTVGPNWAAAMLPLTFEEAVAGLERLPMAYVEPDGSFVWCGDGPPTFRFEGMLHDRGPRLSHVEIIGLGGAEQLKCLLEAAAGQCSALMVQTVRDGNFYEAPA